MAAILLGGCTSKCDRLPTSYRSLKSLIFHDFFDIPIITQFSIGKIIATPMTIGFMITSIVPDYVLEPLISCIAAISETIRNPHSSPSHHSAYLQYQHHNSFHLYACWASFFSNPIPVFRHY
ncbi:hypothetical protein TNIN_262491 [Trichonephila inaurata madagascariensis]|uniref:Uncharacterized protein n=1 Tax=Trichonephila inaurata madagascariensis TaxID=2747483 RepID=A0A8X6XU46_9ARAC|nr:hypothetical protein TNIN_262491 [Trichonephila inaurata madagascariensis]